jgi:hypothetical protein
MNNVNFFFLRSGSFQDKNGKILTFAVKKGTDESIVWKATVRVACCKVDAEKKEVESYRLLNIKQFEKVPRSDTICGHCSF